MSEQSITQYCLALSWLKSNYSWPFIIVFQSIRRWTNPVRCHKITYYYSTMLNVINVGYTRCILNNCRQNYVGWHSLAPIRPAKPTVSSATWSPVYLSESMLMLWNGTKTRPHCAGTKPNTLLKKSHNCICGQSWANTPPIFWEGSL